MNCHRRRVGAQAVGVGHPTRQHQGVVVVDLRPADLGVDGKGVALVEMVEGLHLARLRGEQLRRPPG